MHICGIMLDKSKPANKFPFVPPLINHLTDDEVVIHDVSSSYVSQILQDHDMNPLLFLILSFSFISSVFSLCVPSSLPFPHGFHLT